MPPKPSPSPNLSSSLRLIGSEGGSASAADTAFQAARRAILRCQTIEISDNRVDVMTAFKRRRSPPVHRNQQRRKAQCQRDIVWANITSADQR